MKRIIELPKYINKFLVIDDLGTVKKKRRMVLLECYNCNKKFPCELQNAKRIKSCGCLRKSCIPGRLKRIFRSMIARCYDPNHLTYKSYGAKGIVIYEKWIKDHNQFYDWALANGYNDNLSIDRICPELGYFPENCRWITMQEQIQNRRTITKLNPDLIRSIRKDLLVMRNIDVSKKYNISKSHISCIKHRKHWDNVK